MPPRGLDWKSVVGRFVEDWSCSIHRLTVDGRDGIRVCGGGKAFWVCNGVGSRIIKHKSAITHRSILVLEKRVFS